MPKPISAAGVGPASAPSNFLGTDVHGRTLGIVGYGRIGQAVARRAARFRMTVLHHTRHDTDVPGWTADLDDLFRVRLSVSLHVPLTDDAFHLVGARRSRSCRRAVLVNTARGQVVDEVALADALERGSIFGAGIDVFEQEPQVHPRLLAAPHAVLVPHIGSATEQTRRAMTELACSGVVAVLAGERPPNLVTP
jgi:glyoxylate reductase